MTNRSLAKTIIFISLFFIAVYLYIFYTGKGFVVDEETHARMISSYFRGNYVILDHLTVIPGYHLIVSLFERLFNRDNIEFKRLFSVIVGIISCMFFFKLNRNEHPHESARIKTLQFAFLPVVFPFFFLIYTDTLALLFILLGLYFFSGRNYLMTGVSGLFSMTVRQSNVVWLSYFIILSIIEEGINLKNFCSVKKAQWLKIAKKNITTLLGIILFITFIIFNGGVSLGDKAQHPSFSLHFGNLYLTLFLLFFINLPIFIAEIPNIIKTIKNWLQNAKTAIFFIASTSVFTALFFSTFKITHAYNNIDNYYWIIRNIFLNAVETNLAFKISFLLIIIYTALVLFSFVTTKKTMQRAALIAVSITALAPFWLIEVRYAIIPLVLFQLYRESQSRHIEIIQLFYGILLSLITIYTITNTIYFP